MSTAFIIFYIAAIIAALLALAGIVMIANGLANKTKKSIMTGSILTGISVILIVSGLFFGARKCFRVMHKNCMNKEMKFDHFGKSDFCKMSCDSTMTMDTTMSGDSCKMTIEKKCVMKADKSCDPANCDPSQCKHKCSHGK